MPKSGDLPLEDAVRDLPDEPGVYTFLDAEGSALYIGKAGSLRDRVRSYFTGSHPGRIQLMLNKATNVETVLVDTEAEAYLLESSLIKEKKPRYNVRLTDDKRYPWILVSDEAHPRIDIVRTQDEEGTYYGPFPDVGTARDLVNLLREAFGIRDCPRELPNGCIKHEVGLCMAPCFKDNTSAYLEAVENVQHVLSGNPEPAVSVLEEGMHEAADAHRFEEAARLRDRIEDIQRLLNEQAIFASQREDRDAIFIESTHEESIAVVLPRRNGRIIDQQTFPLPGATDQTRRALLAEFIARYYEDRPSIPHRILVPTLPEDDEALAQALSKKTNRKVRFHVPQRGVGKRMLSLAEKNARYQLTRHQQERGPDPGIVDLKERLKLDALPRRIEATDVSHHGGHGRVGSLVVFTDGHPDKSGYRRYDLEDEVNHDLGGIREIVHRRLKRLARKGEGLPDLFLIDGGQDHANAAREEARALGLEPTILSLAKENETIHRPGWTAPITLPPHAPGLKLLQRARDEAHRFAIRYGRNQREKALSTSMLDAVPGIGATLRNRLLKHHGSLQGVRNASLEELEAVKGVGPTMARRIQTVLHDGTGEQA